MIATRHSVAGLIGISALMAPIAVSAQELVDEDQFRAEAEQVFERHVECAKQIRIMMRVAEAAGDASQVDVVSDWYRQYMLRVLGVAEAVGVSTQDAEAAVEGRTSAFIDEYIAAPRDGSGVEVILRQMDGAKACLRGVGFSVA